ncbi:nucleoside diphosphatase [Niveomyces insectorum RCEF 264]|uniref:Nucleoside diphosphatase n=1 Tax=Niveomyces insectorum RCEF 264 TaxID=1081102 RepID=A0A168A7R3_9HYPO|nr:nucleoside diphosphatase [Niveomyces insectorum RCEF 264]
MGKKWRWGVIVDAGSSGSRLHVYRWKDPARVIKDAEADELHRLPEIKTKWTKKIRPGVSTFGGQPAAVGPAHLQSLVDYALEIVPADMVADTPIFVMATAGMRFLPAPQQTALLREICAYLQAHTRFALPDCRQNIQVISGETEGLYGWLAANYLLGGFDHPDRHVHGQNHHTYGFLDMGGASAQIAFAPNTTEAAAHADDLKLVRLRTLDGDPAEHRVFTATWLGLGVNKARESYVETLVERHHETLALGGAIPDPCLPKGLRTTFDGTIVEGDGAAETAAAAAPKSTAAAAAGSVGSGGSSNTPLLVGTGDFSSCLVNTKPLLGKDTTTCGESTHPCLVHDPVPSIDFHINHFIGVSEYYHSTHGFFGEKDDDRAYDFSTYQRNVRAFCDQDWTQITDEIAGGGAKETARKKSKNKDKDKDLGRTIQDAQQACFKASWVISVLHEGIGIPRVGLEKLPGFNVSHEALEGAKGHGFTTPFRPVDKIDSVEVSWTLGRMLLYASGQVPPRSSELPVGFGSNVKDGSGVTPPDFTYAGSTWEPLKLGSGGGGDGGGSGGWVDHDDDDGDDWSDTADDILDKAREKPASSGLFVFVLLLLVLAFLLLRKKDRRMRLSSKMGSLLRRSRWPGSPPRKHASRFGGSSSSHSSSHSGGGGIGLGLGLGLGIGGSSSSHANTHGGSSTLVTLAKKLFRRRSSHDYERVLEEGQMMNQFELGEADPLDENEFGSDGSEGSGSGSGGSSSSSSSSAASASRLARTSGLATPQQRSVDLFDDPRALAAGSALDRSGLVVRTESRERLGPNLQMLNAGRRSRATSPTRLKSPLMAPLQED